MKSCNAKRRRQRRRERWKTTIGLISKRATLPVQHTFFCTFLCHFFARLQRETSRDFLVTRFMEGMSYVLSFIFFFTAAHSHLALVAASISHFLTTATKFSWCSPNKKMSSLFFISRSRSLSPFFLDELHWPAAYFLFFSVFLFLYIPNLRAW